MELLLNQAQKEALNGNEDAKEAMKKLGVHLHNGEVSAPRSCRQCVEPKTERIIQESEICSHWR